MYRDSRGMVIKMKATVSLICKAFVCFLVGMFYSSCAKDIIDLTGSITGTVKDASTNESLQGCLVSISPSGQSRTTSSNGSYSFENVDAGDYTVSVSKEGYVAENKNVEVVPASITTSDFLLTKIQTITVSPDELQFGDLQSSMEMYLRNNTNSSVTYSVSVNADWITVNKTQGTISKQGQDKISVAINRESLSIGSYSKSVTIKYADGETIIPVYVQQVEKTTPSVAMGEVSNLQETFFDISGTLTATGGLKVTQHGHCYSEKESPTIEDSHTTLGDTEDIYEFSSHITGLTKNTTYYIRAYATNAKGTTYSNQISVITPVIDVPKVSTGEASDVTTESAVLHGVINSNSGSEVTERGFYYGTTENPSTKHTISATENNYSTTLKGLKENTTYYYKAYAVNSKGEAYGEVKNFKTKAEGSDVWDGSLASSFAGGNGSFVNPYLIKSSAQLSYIRKMPSGGEGKYFKLEKNLDLNNIEWVPISNFSGFLDGNGKTISNLYIVKPDDNVGLFANTKNGSITNLKITNVNIDTSNSSNVGALVGIADGTKIEQCNVGIGNGTIIGNCYVGGLCGRLEIPAKYGYTEHQDCLIQKCTVVGDGNRFCLAGNRYIGGCIGSIGFEHTWMDTHAPYVDYLISDICLTGEEYVGGVVGYASQIQFSKLSSKCKIKGESYLGGLFGYGGNIYSSYAIYDIEGESKIAGISNGNKIYACYSIGKLNRKDVEIGPKPDPYTGGGGYYACYYISNYASGIFGDGWNDRKNCTDILNRLKYLDSKYIDEWDFNNTWIWTGTINGKDASIECPRLKWEKESLNIKSINRKR